MEKGGSIMYMGTNWLEVLLNVLAYANMKRGKLGF